MEETNIHLYLKYRKTKSIEMAKVIEKMYKTINLFHIKIHLTNETPTSTILEMSLNVYLV